MKDSNKPLAGIRVLDFGRFVAAPYCGMMLADFGAEVIRIEKPGGDGDRIAGVTMSNGENFGFQTYARNKKGITLDLFRKDNEEAIQVLHDLLLTADVFLHNFSPSAVEHYKLDYETVKRIKPDIIYAGISAFGAEGPYSRRSGFDQVIQFFAGPASLNGTEDTQPMRSVVPWIDYSTGLLATTGILTALRHRDATGEGQSVDAALMSTAVSFMAPFISEHAMLGMERGRVGNRVQFVATTDLFACKDGLIYIATPLFTLFKSLMIAIGHPELIEDPRCIDDETCYENREEIDSYVATWARERTLEEASEVLEKSRIPFGIYKKYTQVAEDPHVQDRKLIETVDLEVDGLKPVPVSGVPIKLSATPGKIVHRPPRVGEHTSEVLRNLLDYDDSKIEKLRDKNII